MIDLYYAPTPNGWKISIMLEECDLDYKVVPVNLGKGDQFKPDFLKISPNNRMPVIVDHTNIIEGEPLSVFESALASGGKSLNAITINATAITVNIFLYINLFSYHLSFLVCV